MALSSDSLEWQMQSCCRKGAGITHTVVWEACRMGQNWFEEQWFSALGSRDPIGNVRKASLQGHAYMHTPTKARSVAGCHCPELTPGSVVCAGESGCWGTANPRALCFLGVSINSTPLGSRTKLSSPFKAALSLTSKRMEESLHSLTPLHSAWEEVLLIKGKYCSSL